MGTGIQQVVNRPIGQWDGQGWSALNDAPSSSFPVMAMEALPTGELIASGNFFGGANMQLARWDGASQWLPIGGITDLQAAYSIAARAGDDVYVSLQSLNHAETPGVIHNGILKWNGTEWTGLGEGIGLYWSPAGTDAGVHALASHAGNVYAGGQFASAGPRTIEALARWDGTRWWNVGGDVFPANSTIYALKSIGGSLYAGGAFTTAGVAGTTGIARWDGSSWHALGTGAGSGTTLDPVRAIESFGGNVVAGGDFRTAGGVATIGLAQWDGVQWSPIDGFAGSVFGMATEGGFLYLGGDFALNGSLTRSHVARWDGSTWTHLGTVSGQTPSVRALAYSNGNLFIGGEFSTIEGVPASRIARWDGTTWHALGDGLPGTVHALWAEGSEVYAAGSFNGTAQNPAYGIAKWDGSTWSSLGIGVHKHLNFPATPTVYALLGTQDGLYLGGDFTHAGKSYSNQIALWTDFTSSVRAEETAGDVPAGFELHQAYPNPFQAVTTLRFRIARQAVVDLRIYDVLGREVALLSNETRGPGLHELRWDARGLSNGVYFYQMRAEGFRQTRRLVLMR
jgi:hypothetical protein